MKRTRVSDNKKTLGRPPTGVGTLVGQRWRDDQLKQIDGWRLAQPDTPGRAEAIRRLVEMGLGVKAKSRIGPRAARAAALAGKVIDSLTPRSAEPEEKASRKHRLLKGPEEFRDVRVDRTKK